MNANEAIEKIKVALGLQAPDVPVELAKKDKVEEVPVVEEEVVEVVEEVAVEKTEAEVEGLEAEAARMKEAEEKLKSDREELEKALEVKLSEQTADILNLKTAMSELLEVVKFLAATPTAEPTEKNNGIRTFLSDTRKDSLAKFQDGFKSINEKIKN